MSPDAIASLLPLWNARPEGIRLRRASDEELRKFEALHGPIPQDFRQFLQVFGGGAVGSEWVDGIEQLTKTHEKFKAETGPKGWQLQGVFIVGWDGSGNPFGIEMSSGAILVEDHDFGGVHEMAPSFEAFLLRGINPNAL